MLPRDDGAIAAGAQSVIGAGMTISGDIRFSGGLRIDGKVVGHVRAAAGQQATLVIGEKGCVEGVIDVPRQTISGMVTGRLEARDFVRLQPGAHVSCDLVYGAAEILPGAVLLGCLMPQAHRVAAEAAQEPFAPAALETAAATA